MNNAEHQKKKGFMRFGLPSILLSFVMVCIVTFSALSFLTVHSDYKLSQKTAENSREYRCAEESAYHKLAETDELLLEAYTASKDEKAYFDYVSKKLADSEGNYYMEEGKNYYCFDETISEHEKLEVTLLVIYPHTLDGGFYQLEGWKNITSHEKSEETYYNLAVPENNEERIDE